MRKANTVGAVEPECNARHALRPRPRNGDARSNEIIHPRLAALVQIGVMAAKEGTVTSPAQ